MADDWKQHHADEAAAVLADPIVQRAMAEFAGNMKFDLDGLPAYGLAKVAATAAQVARAHALGFDPALLLLTPDEANEQLVQRAAEAVYSGIPVHLIGDDDG